MVNVHRRTLVQGALLSPLASLPVAAQAADAPPPLQDFFRPSVLSNAVLSPDGKFLAGLRETNKRSNIVVIDLATRKATIITNFNDSDAGTLRWVNNQRLMFRAYDRTRGGADQVGSGMFAINRDASGFLQLAERAWMTEGRKMLPANSAYHSRVLTPDGKPTDEVRVEVFTRHGLGKSSSNLFRLNTVTGRFTLLTLGAPSYASGWTLDVAGVPRVTSTYDSETEIATVYYRTADASWEPIYQFRGDDPASSIVPLAFDATGTKLYTTAHAGSDNAGIYVYDLATRKLDPNPVASVKGYDLEGIHMSFDEKELLGIPYDAARPGVYWISERHAAIQAKVDAMLPGMTNDLQFGAGHDSGGIVLVASSSDREPGRYFLYDVKADKLQGLGASRPWIKAEQMRPTSFFRYAARDGLQIPAQLTLPAGDGPFPLVVLHYGGPWVRPIHWGFDPHVQFLVSRGYAVFMPAPRASTGFGVKLYKAGWKQWGQGMQDDVADGVRHLIAQGQVDPKRVCIAGASYGGYLTMMGLVKEPELYRCGINWVGVTDPSYMFSVTWSDFARHGGADTDLRRLLGDPEKDAQMFKQISPLQRAAEIKQPVLMAYGYQDQRVPLIHGEKMLAALKPHNRNVEWVTYSDEGHGWQSEATNVDFWGRVERFLATNLK